MQAQAIACSVPLPARGNQLTTAKIKLSKERSRQEGCQNAPALQQLLQEAAQLADADAGSLALVQRPAHARLHRHTTRLQAHEHAKLAALAAREGTGFKPTVSIRRALTALQGPSWLYRAKLHLLSNMQQCFRRRTSSTATSASSWERTASRKRSLDWKSASLAPPTRPDGTELRKQFTDMCSPQRHLTVLRTMQPSAAPDSLAAGACCWSSSHYVRVLDGRGKCMLAAWASLQH